MLITSLPGSPHGFVDVTVNSYHNQESLEQNGWGLTVWGFVPEL